jgi:hypothetical protein
VAWQPAADTVDEGQDWVVVFLGAIALLAILGLIPLWAFVYKAYSRSALPPEALPVFLFPFRLVLGII